MLFPFTHVWTRRQKALIVCCGVCALALFGALIYGYERYYRGPGQEALYGMWYGPNFFTNDPGYLALNPNGNASFGIVLDGQLCEIFAGRWYAGGTKIHLLFTEDIGGMRPWVLHIVDIEGDELRVRFFRKGHVLSYRRVHSDSPRASNHAMERTPTRRAFAFSIATTSSLRPALALGGRRSSYSR